MRKPTQRLLLYNTRLIKCLSMILLIYFSSTIIHNPVMMYFQEQSEGELELCDFPLTESETSGESESTKKNESENSEEFIGAEKSDYHLLSVGNSFVFFVEESVISNRIKEFPTPPPRQIILAI